MSSSGGTPTGTVTFTGSIVDVNGNTQTSTLCSAVTLNGSGQASCNATFSTQGINAVNATYSPTGSFAGSSTTSALDVLVEPGSASITTSGNQWCNTAQIVVPGSFGSGPPILYPSIIPVTGIGQSVADVTVSLKGISAALSVFDGMEFLLVGPGGSTHNLDFLSKAFSGAADSGLNLTIEDGAGQTATETTAATSGNWDPSNNGAFVSPPLFATSTAPTIDSQIPQVPGTITLAPPIGASTNTLQHSFNGSAADGDWSLYIMNDNGTGTGEGLTMANGWCVDFTLNTGVATTTELATSANPATTGTAVPFTATVQTGGNPVSSGTVTFLDNGATPAGTVSGNNVVPLNGSGQATFSTSALSEGDHPMTATFNGTAGDNVSTSPTLVERLDNASTKTNLNTNPVTFCNTGAITLPGAQPPNNTGPASPNPSNIFVANVPGTLAGVDLTLENFSAPNLQNVDLESLVVGPGNATGPALDFFSYTCGTGETTGPATGNFVFLDGGGAMPTNADIAPGSYEASSYHNSADTFFASTSGFYTPPASFNYAQSKGSSTFASTFADKDPNGTWSLYFNENTFTNNISSPANGWCVQLTENAPDIALGASADFNPGTFVKGESGTVTYQVTNNGPGPTGGTLTLLATLPTGLSYTGSSGTGWSCTAGSPVSCSNSTAVASGEGYNALTIDVSVASNAGSPRTVGSSLSGSMDKCSTKCSGSDQVDVIPPPALSVTKSHTGTFTQGQTAQWLVTVSNATGSATTSDGLNVADTLPTGYTLASYTSTGSAWTCSGTGTNSVLCGSTTAIAGGGSSAITLTVNVAASSATSVSNTASAWGGGDPGHTSQGTAATGSDLAVPVVQVPATITINGSQTQSAQVGTAFGSLAVTVKDAGGVVTPNYASVTFTASEAGSGATGSFSNSTGTITLSTNGSGVADPGVLTANLNSGLYNVSVSTTTGSASASFSMTNTPITPTITWTPVGTVIFGDAGANVLNAGVSCTGCGTITYTATPNGGSPASIATTTSLVAGSYTITATFNPSANTYATTSATNPLTVSGESVWIVNSGAGGTSELAGNGAGITSSADPGANLAVAIDNAGNVWSVGAGPLVKETSQTGIVQHSINSGGGLNTPAGVAIDGNGQVWVTDGSGALSLFSNSASVISPSGGIMDPTLLSTPGGIAVDLGGSVWIANKGNNSVTRILGGAAPAAPLATAAANGTTGAKP